MKNNKYVFIVTGAAGSGKTTVANYLQDHYDMHRVITHMLEQVTYDQFQYGSSLEGLAEGWKHGKNDVIVLDTAGAITYHQQLGAQAVIIFLTVTHMASLAKRMTLRGDKLSAIRSRLHSKEYHRDLALPAALKGIAHVVVNDQWKNTKQQIDIIVRQILSKKN